MIYSIPIFIEERPAAGTHLPAFSVRPLFHSSPVEKSGKLHRALNKLALNLKRLLYDLGAADRHDDLAAWAFDPEIDENTLELRLELGSGSERMAMFLAGYEALDRRLYFNPLLPDLHFEVLPGQTLPERATEVYTHYFRDQAKKDPDFNLHEMALRGKARLTSIEVEVSLAGAAKKSDKTKRALIFGSHEKKDGFKELQKTGRPLRSLYPDDLRRAIGRENEVAELAKILSSTDRRPILLAGRRKAGKTAVLHELVWQMCARKKERFAGVHEIWLLSPMRLISGMSYLGEWENRVLAILDYAQKKDQVLYFDDLPGLFSAGVSCASDLNVAQALKPALEKQSVRLVAEITPEALRVLRERDRAFIDLFHIIPIPESTEPETYRVLIHTAQQLEEQHRTLFDSEVVPVVYELFLRFAGDAAFPGKAVEFMRRLAERHAGKPIQRKQAFDEFSLQSGMQLALLDGRERLTGESITQALQKGLAGQDHVLEAFAEVILTLKTRLNDVRRPLAVMLLLGPTGVGKTESAKVLARYLFGNADRLLRFDMNEYVEGSSAGKLAGTIEEPDGLLTGAIRRQPFSVLLFDEIEKAAPEVFDLLLAILDEGRLADAQGRVAEFTNAVILLTSNLGVREAGARLGFSGAEPARRNTDDVYIAAAEKFFRPEFFNRIDRVLPFHSLESAHLESIARQLIANVFARDGLKRRECQLRVSPEAMSRLVILGRQPQYGARALKRVIESEVAQPLAEHLAHLPPGTPAMAHFDLDGGLFALRLTSLAPVARSVFWPEKAAALEAEADDNRLAPVLTQIADALRRIDRELKRVAPSGKIELDRISPAAAHYFACREQWSSVERQFQTLKSSQGTCRPFQKPVIASKSKPLRETMRQYHANLSKPFRHRLQERNMFEAGMEDLESSESSDATASPLGALCCELALLEAISRRPWQDGSIVLTLQALDESDLDLAYEMVRHYRDFFASLLGGSVSYPENLPNEESMLKKVFTREQMPHFLTLFVKGHNLGYLLPQGAATLLVRRKDGSLGVLNLQINATSPEAAGEFLQHRPLSPDQTTPQPGTGHCPVIGMIAENQNITDYRSGVSIPVHPSLDDFRRLALSTLPLPGEVAL